MSINARLRKGIELDNFYECVMCDKKSNYLQAKIGVQCHIEDDGYRVIWKYNNEWMTCEQFDEIFELI